MTHRIFAPHGSVASSAAYTPPRRGLTVWLTGLSGAGKSTLADATQRQLLLSGVHALRVDGDQLRAGLCDDLQFSPDDRKENVRRAAQVARLLNDQGALAVVSLISPTEQDRLMAREIVGAPHFLEVYVRADVEACRRRDPKGLYARVARGEVRQFTGISAPYEPPSSPQLMIDTTITTVVQGTLMLTSLIEDALQSADA